MREAIALWQQQGPRCRHRRRERKEEEERDNEAEDPGERIVAHSTQGERKVRDEGRTSRPAGPLAVRRQPRHTRPADLVELDRVPGPLHETQPP